MRGNLIKLLESIGWLDQGPIIEGYQGHSVPLTNPCWSTWLAAQVGCPSWTVLQVEHTGVITPLLTVEVVESSETTGDDWSNKNLKGEDEESVVVLCPIEGEVAINHLIKERMVVEWGRADLSLKDTQAISDLVHWCKAAAGRGSPVILKMGRQSPATIYLYTIQ